MAAKNSIDLETDPRVIMGTRVFDAPRDLVFSVWTDPEAPGAMVGSERLHHDDAFIRIPPGGIWRFVMHGPDGRDYQNRIIFDEIVRPNASSIATAAVKTSSRCSSRKP